MILLAFYQSAEYIGEILLHVETHILAGLNESMIFQGGHDAILATEKTMSISLLIVKTDGQSIQPTCSLIQNRLHHFKVTFPGVFGDGPPTWFQGWLTWLRSCSCFVCYFLIARRSLPKDSFLDSLRNYIAICFTGYLFHRLSSPSWRQSDGNRNRTV